MKRKITLLLTLLLTMQFSTLVMAHPVPIEKKSIDLKTETIIIQEKGKASLSPSENTYNITRITSDGTEGNEVYNISALSNTKKLAVSAVLKVDISDVKSVADFNLKFTFSTGTCVGNSLQVHYVTYNSGEALMNTLSTQSSVTGAAMPNAISTSSNRLIYEYKNTDGVDKEIVGTISSEVDLLKEHLNRVINNGEDSVYLLISCETPYDKQESATAYFKVYTSRSTDKEPSFSIGAMPITSGVIKAENGYTYKVSNLNTYTENAMIIVAIYNSKGEVVKAAISTKGEYTVDIICGDASSIRSYIWEAGTLKPITYVEIIDL